MIMGNTLEVVVLTPNRLNSGSAMASKAAITKGKASGWQPVMAALIAAFSIVATPWRGASVSITSSAAYGVAATNSRTAASVGARIGNPSPQPSAMERS